MTESVYIVSAKRTAIGSFLGQFQSFSAPQLGAKVIHDALHAGHVTEDMVEECIMGQVLTAGAGQAPARQAALYAGLTKSTPCMTINKVCGSGLKAVMLAHDSILLGHSQTVVAGGQECMSQAPHLLKNSRMGYRLGHVETLDSLIYDGLWDPYNDFHMGLAAESCVKEYKFSREEQDEYAIESYKRAQEAHSQGHFQNEITPVEITSKAGTTKIDQDEEPQKVKFDKIPGLRPAFDKAGTITAANASSINDGASALVLMSETKMKEMGLKPLAKIKTHATFAQDPKWFTTAPVTAMKKALDQAGLSAPNIDLWEVNEAFSVVTMAAMKDLNIPRDKMNIHGGAVSLGHPIGASGARILTTLIHALRQKEKSLGMASLCIGGGEAVAMIVEAV